MHLLCAHSRLPQTPYRVCEGPRLPQNFSCTALRSPPQGTQGVLNPIGLGDETGQHNTDQDMRRCRSIEVGDYTQAHSCQDRGAHVHVVLLKQGLEAVALIQRHILVAIALAGCGRRDGVAERRVGQTGEVGCVRVELRSMEFQSSLVNVFYCPPHCLEVTQLLPDLAWALHGALTQYSVAAVSMARYEIRPTPRVNRVL